MRLVDAEEAYKVLTDYYHHKTEIQHNALKEAIERVHTVDIDAITESHERIGYDRGFRDGYAEALKETDNVPDKNVGKRLVDADAFFNDFPELKNYEHASQEYEVDAEPVKHGHWVEQNHEDWKWSKEYRCSECGKYRLVTTPVGREWNYCPYCGAKMEVEE